MKRSRHRLNAALLWLLDGPKWWSGLALMGTGLAVIAFIAGYSGVIAPVMLAGFILSYRPWIAVLIVGATCLYCVLQYPFDPWVIAGFVLTALGMLWIISRRSQVEHYRRIAAHETQSCPVCGYDYRTGGSDVCPECGTNVPEYMARVRNAVK